MLQNLREKIAREARFVRTFGTILSRIRKAKPNVENTIPDAIERWVRERPHRDALVDGDRTLTYRQMDELANRVARWAQAQGVRRGDVVGLMMSNRLEYVCMWLGVLKMGGVCALINSHLRGVPLAHSVRTSGCKHLIIGGEHADQWASGVSTLEDPPVVWEQNPPGVEAGIEGARSFDETLSALSGAPLSADVRRGVMCQESAIYIYTSGTTGLPKAAKITHIRGLNMMHGFAGAMGSNETDRIYVPMPLYHGTGGMGGVGAALTVGACLVIRDKFSASHFWTDIVQHRCTMFTYVGELCRYLVNSPPHPDERRHRIRCCMGNGLRPEVWEGFRDRFRLPHIVEFYGSSEGNVAFFNIDDKVGSVGRLPPYTRNIMNVRVVEFDVEREEVVRNADGRVIECAPGQTGKVIGLIDESKPGGRFDGYADPQATRKKILTDAFKPGDRWFRSGDLLSRDADGYFYFVDRIGDTFRWKGENVATSEVTEVLSVFEAIDEVNVYGVQIPGADGRAGMAAIVAPEDLNLEALYTHVSRDLAAFARPLFLRRRAAMEVTGTLKHRKVDLVKEGFDPSAIDEPLFMRDDVSKTFVPLTEEMHAGIIAGTVRV